MVPGRYQTGIVFSFADNFSGDTGDKDMGGCVFSDDGIGADEITRADSNARGYYGVSCDPGSPADFNRGRMSTAKPAGTLFEAMVAGSNNGVGAGHYFIFDLNAAKGVEPGAFG
jgi:hypothetical protein